MSEPTDEAFGRGVLGFDAFGRFAPEGVDQGVLGVKCFEAARAVRAVKDVVFNPSVFLLRQPPE